MADKVELARTVSLRHVFPDELQTHFVTHLVIQYRQDHFVVSFFEVFAPPILGDTEDERREQIDATDEVEATCVSRLVVTPDRMREFIETMTTSYERFVGELEGVLPKVEEDAE